MYNKDAVMRFEKKINSGFFRHDRSQNTEVDYASEKEERDTKFTERAADSGLYRELFKNS